MITTIVFTIYFGSFALSGFLLGYIGATTSGTNGGLRVISGLISLAERLGIYIGLGEGGKVAYGTTLGRVGIAIGFIGILVCVLFGVLFGNYKIIVLYLLVGLVVASIADSIGYPIGRHRERKAEQAKASKDK